RRRIEADAGTAGDAAAPFHVHGQLILVGHVGAGAPTDVDDGVIADRLGDDARVPEQGEVAGLGNIVPDDGDRLACAGVGGGCQVMARYRGGVHVAGWDEGGP